MLVCQCNVISSREIEEVILSFLHEDPWAIIVPAKVYRELERRCKCSGCVPNVMDIITKVTAEYHLQIAADPASAPAAAKVRPASGPRRVAGGMNEGRTASHRAA